MSIQAATNASFPNRIELYFSPYIGPLTQTGPLGTFNPTRDLEVYVDGTLFTVQSWSFDVAFNRYLLFLPQQFDLQGIVQLLHHMPSPPFFSANFLGGSGPVPIPAFAIIAVFTSSEPTTSHGWGLEWGSFWG